MGRLNGGAKTDVKCKARVAYTATDLKMFLVLRKVANVTLLKVIQSFVVYDARTKLTRDSVAAV